MGSPIRMARPVLSLVLVALMLPAVVPAVAPASGLGGELRPEEAPPAHAHEYPHVSLAAHSPSPFDRLDVLPLKEGTPNPPCLGPIEETPELGTACPVATGWKVFVGEGFVLTHGPDPKPPADVAGHTSGASTSPIQPACTTDPNVYHNLLIYAAPPGKDTYTGTAPFIRDQAAKANGFLATTSRQHGAEIHYRFLCDASGAPVVKKETNVPTSGSPTFSAIVSELRNRGYDSSKGKYWIWYDGGSVEGAAGIGTFTPDERPGADNWNNVGPDWAVTFQDSWFVMMHESGHNLGAVQYSAPQSSGDGAHCNDGSDVMCYSDGGDKSLYNGNVCSGLRWDCNADTYWNPSPAPDTYLAKNWNLASPVNRFLDFCGTPSNGAHEVGVCTLSSSRWVGPGEPTWFNGTVRNNAGSTETDLTVRLLIEGTVVDTMVVPTLAPGQTADVSLVWTASSLERLHNASLAIVPPADDAVGTNNQKNTTIRVAAYDGLLRVAVWDSPGTDAYNYFGWPEYESWWDFGRMAVQIDRTSLRKEGITLANLHATNADVILLPDAYAYSWNLTAPEVAALSEYLDEGHGLVGTWGTLNWWTSTHNVAPLFGLAPATNVLRCPDPKQPRTLTFAGAAPILRERLPDPYVTGMDCGLSPPVATTHATVEASSSDDHFKVYLYPHRSNGRGAGAALFSSFDPYVVGFKASRTDLQFGYNAIRWAYDESRPFAQDLSTVRLSSPAIVCVGYDFLAEGVVRNLGTTTSSAATATLTFAGSTISTWSLDGLAPSRAPDYPATTLSATVPGPTATGSQALAFSVAAAGDPAPGNDAKSATLDVRACVPPGAPGGLTATAGPKAGELTVAWDAPTSDGGAPVTHYDLYRAAPGGSPQLILRMENGWGTGRASYVDKDLGSATSWTYWVAAEHAAGLGALSAPVTGTTFSGFPLTAPTSGKIVQGDLSLTLTWTAPAPGTNEPATGYRVYRGTSPTDLTERATVTTTTYTDSGLTEGIVYYYAVAALNAAGEGDHSAVLAAQALLGRAGPGVVWSGSYAYIFGGWGGRPLDQVLRYHPETNLATTTAAKLPSGRYGAAAVWDPRQTAACPSGCAYIFGGYGNATPGLIMPEVQSFRSVLRYDASTGQVTTLAAQLPAGRARMASFFDGTHAYLLGGSNGNFPTDEILKFDPLTETLTKTPTVLPVPRWGIAAAWTGSKAYLFGGSSGSFSFYVEGEGTSQDTATDQILTFDPATGIIAPSVAKLPFPSTMGAASYDGRYAYAFGGTAQGWTVPYTSRLDPTNDQLTRMSHMLSIVDLAATWDGNHTLRAGGCSFVGCAGARMPGASPYLITPTKPTSLRTTSTNPATLTVNLAWAAPVASSYNEITAYRIFRSEAGQPAQFLTQVSGTSLSYSDTAPSAGSFDYRVSAVNQGRDESPQSDKLTVTLPAPPAAPELTATQGATRGQIQLSWTTPSNGGSAITGYRVYRGTSSGALSLLTTVTGTSHTDGGLADATTYVYQVSALNVAGEGARSSETSATTRSVALPGAPGQPAVTDGPLFNAPHVEWTAPASPGDPPATRYRVWRAASGGTATLVADIAADGGTLWNAGFENATEAPWTRYGGTGCTHALSTAWQASGAKSAYLKDASASAACGIWQERPVVPGATYTVSMPTNVASGPVHLRAEWLTSTRSGIRTDVVDSSGTGAQTLATTQVAPTNAVYLRVWLYVSTAGQGEAYLDDVLLRFEPASGGIAYVDSGLAPATTYDYEVSAVSSIGEGARSAATSYTTGSGGAPGAPQDVAAAVTGSGVITVSWSAPAPNGNPSATSYKLYRVNADGSTTLIVTTTGTSFSSGGNTGGQTYSYVVRALNSLGEGPASPTVSVMAVQAPTAPLNLVACSGNENGYVAWNAPASNGGEALANYLLYRKRLDESTFTLVATLPGTTLSYTDPGLTVGQQYTYYAKAKNRFEGPASNQASAIIVGENMDTAC